MPATPVPAEGEVLVVIATRTLKPGEQVTRKDLKVVAIPAVYVPVDRVVASTDGLIGRTVMEDLLKGDPVRETRLATLEQGAGAQALVPTGMEQVTVEVDDPVVPVLSTGDRVDVVAVDPNDPSAPACVVVENAPVLVTHQELQKWGAGPTYALNLAVYPGAKTLFAAVEGRPLRLTLRNQVGVAVGDGAVPLCSEVT